MTKDKKDDERTKLRLDVNETAFRVMLEATGQAPKTPPPGERDEDEKYPEAVERGEAGGRIGGRVRAAKLTKADRQRIAREAAEGRWDEDDG